MMTIGNPYRLSHQQVRWTCDPDAFGFETTEEMEPELDIIGQVGAYDALKFGIQCEAPGQNVYVRGSQGTGRSRMVARLLDELKPATNKKCDYCYVHNFTRPQSPRLIKLPPGDGPMFRKVISEVADFIGNGLRRTLDAEPIKSQLREIKDSIEESIKAISKPLEDKLAASNLMLVSMQNGPLTQTVIMPTIDGEPLPPQQLKALVSQGKVDQERLTTYSEQLPKFQKELQEVGQGVAEAFRDGGQKLIETRNRLASDLIREFMLPILRKFDYPAVRAFLDEVVDDAVENRLNSSHDDEGEVALSEVYGVNVVLTHKDRTSKPVIIECAPNLVNLLGTVEPKWGPGGMVASDFRGIVAGALLNANHGYLVLDANDVLAEPGAWRALMRTIRTGRLEIVPPEFGWIRQQAVLQPEPIEIDVRVILIGNVATYNLLDHHDLDFREHFKVLADFDSELLRNSDSIRQYASVVANIVRQENLPSFHKTAIAVLVEHGARIAARSNHLTAKFGRLADLIREAAFLAETQMVTGDHVLQAIRRTKYRAALPSRKFQQLVASKTILVQTQGQVVGQINGLAVMYSGPLTYGFPARITATIGPGRAGLINIEGQARMSGAIHTKGFYIIGGLLRHLLRNDHPLAFSASLAFEQSYGGIDGDSASGAEVVCLLSALTGIPIDQGLAMTGAIDQHGHVEAIGGVNEKIEGFYDSCQHFGLTGTQGVVIPQANQGDLMLRDEVVQACREGTFHIYAVGTIYEAIEVLMGTPAGSPAGEYPEGTVLAIAVAQAREFWKRTLASPTRLTQVESNQPADTAEITALADDHSEGLSTS